MSEPACFSLTLDSVAFDADYVPSDTSRATTNFANLARGPNRRENLTRALQMMNRRFNALADWDNPTGDRYALQTDIISASISITGRPEGERFTLIELLQTRILDRAKDLLLDGITGNNFSSYVRDYDFSLLLPKHNGGRQKPEYPENFGELHGQLFKSLIGSVPYQARFPKPPVICLSVSTTRTYVRTANVHPVLGTEYMQPDPSSTDVYFGKMGLRVRYFMPRGAVAPMAFYCGGDLLADYTNLELISTISTMESFQKIYRPEVYNANAAAGHHYRPSLTNGDYSLTQVEYDRDERSRLAVDQAALAEAQFVRPFGAMLERYFAANPA